jgi:hypothetical protein
MSDEVTVGSYRADANRSESMIQITLFPSDLVKYWSRCGLTADFAASFLAFRFPDSKKASNSLSVILNEIVENAVKFSNTKNGKIAINLFNLADLIIYEVENYVDESRYQDFREKAEQLLDGNDIETKYFAALREKAENPSGSGLGLLTILHDFGAHVGVRFVREENGLYRVSLQVHMRPEEVLA